MSEDRPGEGGKNFSKAEAKNNMGRSFRRVSSRHEGQSSNETEWKASRNLAKGGIGDEGPSKTELEMSKEDNPSAWKVYKDSGMSDQEIYDILSRNH